MARYCFLAGVIILLTACGDDQKVVAQKREKWLERCQTASFTQAQCALLAEINAAAEKASDDASDASTDAAIAQVRASIK